MLRTKYNAIAMSLNFKLDKLYSEKVATALFHQLEQEIDYLKDPTLFINGQNYKVPRQIVGYGNPNVSYAFSGIKVAAKPWTPTLLKIRKDVSRYSGIEFNFVLVNRYANGQDHINKHQDRDCGDVICAVSFGDTRKFVFSRKGYQNKNLMLTHGSILTMRHPTNKYWFHHVPKTALKKKPRISLTFRTVTPAE